MVEIFTHICGCNETTLQPLFIETAQFAHDSSCVSIPLAVIQITSTHNPAQTSQSTNIILAPHCHFAVLLLSISCLAQYFFLWKLERDRIGYDDSAFIQIDMVPLRALCQPFYLSFVFVMLVVGRSLS